LHKIYITYNTWLTRYNLYAFNMFLQNCGNRFYCKVFIYIIWCLCVCVCVCVYNLNHMTVCTMCERCWCFFKAIIVVSKYSCRPQSHTQHTQRTQPHIDIKHEKPIPTSVICLWIKKEIETLAVPIVYHIAGAINKWLH
jgi:hypothetical protein